MKRSFPHSGREYSVFLPAEQEKYQPLGNSSLTVSTLWRYSLPVAEKLAIGTGTPSLRKRIGAYLRYLCAHILSWRRVRGSRKTRRFFRSGCSKPRVCRRPHAWNHDRRSDFIRKETVMSDRLFHIALCDLLKSSQRAEAIICGLAIPLSHSCIEISLDDLSILLPRLRNITHTISYFRLITGGAVAILPAATSGRYRMIANIDCHPMTFFVLVVGKSSPVYATTTLLGALHGGMRKKTGV